MPVHSARRPKPAVRRRARLRAAAVLAVAIGLAAPASSAETSARSPAVRAHAAGEVLETARFPGAPAGASATKIVYRSTGLDGEPIAVSGLVIAPPRPADGYRGIVAWAHPTTGVAEPCAPSLRAGVFHTIPGLADLLSRGYVVATTDYPGLGEPGMHPYLVGVSEGRAVLDSVRAARSVVGPPAGERFAVWGHSQGGHAALFAGELASAYAPELDLVGIAAAAPATDLRALFANDLASAAGKVLTSFTLRSWAKIYRLDLGEIVAPAALPAVERIAAGCLEDLEQALRVRIAEAPLANAFLTRDPTTTSPWKDLMEANTPGRHEPGGPVFIAQGSKDRIVEPDVTMKFVEGLCRRGAPVRLVILEGVSHDAAGRKGATYAVEWIAERFEGTPAPSDCRGG